jgi:ABC-type bacteriocin/lantibiotic exporter with double-glycine peptidase domain
MTRSVPAYSQYLDVRLHGWPKRACGIVALKMLLDYLSPRMRRMNIDNLIVFGLAREAYIPGVGWKHRGLAKLAEEFGLEGKNYDWADIDPKAAFVRMRRHAHFPFLASVHKHFDSKNGGHLIVVTKVEDGLVHYHEPASHSRARIPRTVDTTAFLSGWKRRIITVRPRIAKSKNR